MFVNNNNNMIEHIYKRASVGLSHKCKHIHQTHAH